MKRGNFNFAQLTGLFGVPLKWRSLYRLRKKSNIVIPKGGCTRNLLFSWDLRKSRSLAALGMTTKSTFSEAVSLRGVRLRMHRNPQTRACTRKEEKQCLWQEQK